MSKPLIKATYHLDASTVRKLDDMARRRGVSASEALREAIKLASVNGSKKQSSALKALDNLQTSLKLTSAKARAWANKAHTERRASSSHAARRR
jgi:Arc/MetJ-type ribon-helix-helix transcriptional regulator